MPATIAGEGGHRHVLTFSGTRPRHVLSTRLLPRAAFTRARGACCGRLEMQARVGAQGVPASGAIGSKHRMDGTGRGREPATSSIHVDGPIRAHTFFPFLWQERQK